MRICDGKQQCSARKEQAAQKTVEKKNNLETKRNAMHRNKLHRAENNVGRVCGCVGRQRQSGIEKRREKQEKTREGETTADATDV